MPRDHDQASLHDIVEAARLIADFVESVDHQAFLEDAKTRSAVIHQLLVIGEAVKRLSSQLRDNHPQVPWSLIARTRDMLIHHYEAVDPEEVWRIVQGSVPDLVPTLEAMIDASDEATDQQAPV